MVFSQGVFDEIGLTACLTALLDTINTVHGRRLRRAEAPTRLMPLEVSDE